jgi:hypothetical protein
MQLNDYSGFGIKGLRRVVHDPRRMSSKSLQDLQRAPLGGRLRACPERKNSSWFTIGIFIVACLSLYADVRDKPETAAVVLLIICNLLLMLAMMFALYMNLHDAHRAKSLRAQIITIRDEHKTALACARASLAAAQKQALISEKAKEYWMQCYSISNTEKEDLRKTLDEVRGDANEWKRKAEELQSTKDIH